MHELTLQLQEARRSKGYAFVPYLAVGDPDLDTTRRLIRRLIRIGADAIELGLPFTDPTADGPVLQRAFRRVLARPFSWDSFWRLLRDLNKEFPSFPFLVMGYANLFYRQGFREVLEKLAAHGVKGVIIPDVPVEERIRLIRELQLEEVTGRLAWVPFVTPIVTPERLALAAQNAAGFVYIVSVRGVTGSAKFDVKPLKPVIRKLRKLTDVPLLIGFGIREKRQAKDAMNLADGFIIGSRIHEIIEIQGGDAARTEEAVAVEIAGILPPIKERPEKKRAGFNRRKK